MKYITKKHELKDKKIIDDLNRAAEMYEDGEIIEVRDMLADMVNAIDEFAENFSVSAPNMQAQKKQLQHGTGGRRNE